ncbi:MAG: nucleoside deaminase [Anaerolineales bacterium]
MLEINEGLIRETIKNALSARRKGNHPFGALLAGPDGEVLLQAENTVVTSRDVTAHAELNLIRKASAQFDPGFLAQCTLYTSAEPCPMCAGAIFWSNIRRVVFGLSEKGLYEFIPGESDEELVLPCREVFARGKKSIKVIGPLLENEARKPHQGFWK